VTVQDVIRSHPHPGSLDRELLFRCLEECFDCAPTCTACADANLAEPDIDELVRCIRLCLDCADVCDTTGRVLTRQTEADPGVLRVIIDACLAACSASAEECERHAAHHEHCRLCAVVCRRCEQACRELAESLG